MQQTLENLWWGRDDERVIGDLGLLIGYYIWMPFFCEIRKKKAKMFNVPFHLHFCLETFLIIDSPKSFSRTKKIIFSSISAEYGLIIILFHNCFCSFAAHKIYFEEHWLISWGNKLRSSFMFLRRKICDCGLHLHPPPLKPPSSCSFWFAHHSICTLLFLHGIR